MNTLEWFWELLCWTATLQHLLFWASGSRLECGCGLWLVDWPLLFA